MSMTIKTVLDKFDYDGNSLTYDGQPIKGDGGSTRGDWQQSDPAAKDYIKIARTMKPMRSRRHGTAAQRTKTACISLIWRMATGRWISFISSRLPTI